MKKTIYKLRQKEQHEKESIAFIGALVITAFIVLFWLAGVTAFQNPTKDQQANVSTPWESFREQFNDIVN